MNTRNILTILVLASLFGCKASQPTGPSNGSTPSLLDVATALNASDSMFFAYADSTHGDVWRSLGLTALWLQNQPNISSVFLSDSTHLEFTMKSGLQSTFYIDLINSDSMSYTRGGNPFGNLGGRLSRSGILSDSTISNKNILFYVPEAVDFYRAYNVSNLGFLKPTIDVITNSGLGLSVTLLLGDKATYSQLSTFGNYGLVIIDTHGVRNGFLTGTSFLLWSLNGATPTNEAEIKAIFDEHQPGMYDLCTSGKLWCNGHLKLDTSLTNWWVSYKSENNPLTVTLWAPSSYIRSLPQMPKTVIFGNMCYSGYSLPTKTYENLITRLDGKVDTIRRVTHYDPIQAAFVSRNPISYYGWAYDDGSSSEVDNFTSIITEDSVVTAFVKNLDSTGNANLNSDGSKRFDPYHSIFSPLFLQHFGADNYSYMRCGDTLVDPRDGQKYATVCLNGQIWMAQNLNFNALGSFVYNKDPSNAAIYGRLYNWTTLMQGASGSSATPSGVQGVCPKGWHVPSDNEFAQMVATFGNSVSVGGALKSTSSLWQSPNAGATNASGFSGLPAGTAYSDGTNTTFEGLGINAQFGTTTLRTNGNPSVVWVLDAADSSTGSTSSVPQTANSCRCVKDQ